MKNRRFILLAALIMAVSAVLPAFANNGQLYDRTAPIPSVRITVNTGELQAGDMLADDASCYVTIEDNMYYIFNGADWLDSVSSLKVGDEPRMKVYLSAIPRETVYDTYVKSWYFIGNYTSTNTHVSGGEFISAGIRDSGHTLEVTIRVRGVKGSYEIPQNVEWDATLGKAKWEAGNNDSGVYDLVCYRNELIVKKLEKYSGNYYNFYPYMTKAGDYTFKVRCAVPNGKENTGAYASDYGYSGVLTITESNRSNGQGQTTTDEKNGSASYNGDNTNYPNGTGNENVAGWVTDSTGTYFRYPSGVIAKNCWIELGGNFYLLGENGKRLTGWQINPSKTNWFYMDPATGIMKTGWFRDGQYWYYLEPEGASKGMRISGWRDINGKRYFFNDAGVMVTGWFEIGGKWYYFYPEGSRTDGSYGFLATNTRIGDFNIGPDGTWQH